MMNRVLNGGRCLLSLYFSCLSWHFGVYSEHEARYIYFLVLQNAILTNAATKLLYVYNNWLESVSKRDRIHESSCTNWKLLLMFGARRAKLNSTSI